jgi:MFS family permease
MGTIGLIMTVPGQTIGVSVFTGSIVHMLGITQSDLSLAYLIGTAGSALLLSTAGRLYDRLGARLLGACSAALLGLVLLLGSFSPQVSRFLSSALGGAQLSVVAFVVITITFFLLRFSGQGMLSISSRNMVMEWFDRRRGLANAVLGVAVSFGFSLAPRLFESLLRNYGWQGAWRLMAVILVGFAPLALIMFRNRPEDHGLIPDGRIITPKLSNAPESHPAKDFTLRQARRTFAFWHISLTLFMAALLLTAFTFHIVSLFKAAGMTQTEAVSIFLPGSMVALGLQFAGSWASDYIKLKYFALIQLAGLMAVSVGIAFLAPGWPVALSIVGYGVNQGMFGILNNVTWPRFFGRQHLGAISGFSAALGVAGSAAGPYLFSLARDFTGAYREAALLCLLICAVLFVGAWWTERPRHPDEG